MNLAQSKNLLIESQIPNPTTINKILKNLIPDVKPSLLHGDLWNGNYLIREDGIPYLIDPAVYIGHNEVDLAMTRLFRGFPDEFYNSYHETSIFGNTTSKTNDLYQLYYLLVHLNLFGKPYLDAVLKIMKKYF